MTKHIDTLLLRSFVSTVHSGSVGEAARVLKMTQPGVSKHVRRLEDVVGSQLLIRGPRGVALTNGGEQFLVYAERMLAINDEVLSAFAKSKRMPKITIGVQDILASQQLSEACIKFQQLYPGIQVKLNFDEKDHLRQQLDEGLCDLVVAEQDCIRPYLLVHRKVATHWLAAQSFDFTRRPLPIVAFSAPCSARKAALQALSEAGVPWEIVFESACSSAVQTATAAGLGLANMAFVPDNVELLDVTGHLPRVPAMEVGVAILPNGHYHRQLRLMATELVSLMEIATG